ncbi:GIY-YIG nuclease family protein [Nocardioides rubriscoriae]|uniref:GIY-YIG nuclease family protein n=1 Tax=Nocardioides rubriscoriae TaxID=642762 RepID=UPI0011DF9B2B|nr:GIY-YIG nuclease family protein [Nocardioides rubriscoriae]
MPWTYLLRCADDAYYVGSTFDLERRVAQHQAGEGAAYTRHRRPVALVWAAEFAFIRDAFVFEKQVQNWRRSKREALSDGRVDLLPSLASRCWSARQAVADDPPRASESQRAVPPVMPWDVEHEVVHDPDDPWAPLRQVEKAADQQAGARCTRILPDGWSRVAP